MKSAIPLSLLPGILVLMTWSATAQSPTDDAYWTPFFNAAGVLSPTSESPTNLDWTVVSCLAMFKSNLYVAGSFTSAGGLPATNIARWDGAHWFPVVDGTNNGVNGHIGAMAVQGTNLYVGGDFTKAGDCPALYVARWDGFHWSPLWGGTNNGVNGPVLALACLGDAVYVGGQFSRAGIVAATNVARWDALSSAWSDVGGGVNDTVYALTAQPAGVYVGGRLTKAGSTTVNYVAEWDGTNWSDLAGGVTDTQEANFAFVYALAATDGVVYAGGSFSSIGGTAAKGVAKWNGNAWSSMSTNYLGGGGYPIQAINAASGKLYVGGGLLSPSANQGGVLVAQWDGQNWLGLGGLYADDFGRSCSAITVDGTNVYAGGHFIDVDGRVIANHVAKWDGVNWSPLGVSIATAPGGFEATVAVSGANVFIGGSFLLVGSTTASNLAQWNGMDWSALDDGIGLAPGGLLTALSTSGTNLFAGWVWDNAGTNAARHIARWDGAQWHLLGAGTYNGLNRAPFVLLNRGGDLFAGGIFTEAGGVTANQIARWDGTRWYPLLSGGYNGVSGGGTPPTAVQALAVHGGDLYVGGYFSQAGPVAASNVAKWDGTNWSALGEGLNNGVNGGVYGLAVIDTNVYAVGYITTAGGQPVNLIARWDGSRWSNLNGGLTGSYDQRGIGGTLWPNSPRALCLAVHGPDLYVGGTFTMAGSVAVRNIARWDGENWFTLGSGVGLDLSPIDYSWSSTLIVVNSMAISDDRLFAIGWFNRAGQTRCYRFAQWNLPPTQQLPRLRGGQSVGGGFAFNLLGETEHPYQIQRSVDLTNWVSIGSITNTNNVQPFIDNTTGKDSPRKFYRAVTP